MGVAEKRKEEKTGVLVECEICDRSVRVISENAGVTICAACLRDIASQHIDD